MKRDKKSGPDVFRPESFPDGTEPRKSFLPRKTTIALWIFGAWAASWLRLSPARNCKSTRTLPNKAFRTTKASGNRTLRKLSRNASSLKEIHAIRSRQFKVSPQRTLTWLAATTRLLLSTMPSGL